MRISVRMSVSNYPYYGQFDQRIDMIERRHLAAIFFLTVLSVQKVLSSSDRATRRWTMYFPIKRSLPARPKPDNTFWTPSTIKCITAYGETSEIRWRRPRFCTLNASSLVYPGLCFYFVALFLEKWAVSIAELASTACLRSPCE